jgi:hypothetical protein
VDKVLATARSLGVLVGVWALLALVALVAGVIPPFGEAPRDGVEAEDDEAGEEEASAATASDAGAPADAATAAAEVGTEEGTPIEVPRVRRAATPFAICRGVGATSAPMARALDVIGDSRPELVVSCGARAVVLAIPGGCGAYAEGGRPAPGRGGAEGAGDPAHCQNDGLAPTRVAVLDAAAPADEGETTAPSLVTGAVASMDVDGDSLPDLVVPVADAGDSAARGGGAFLVRRQASGGFEPAARLVPPTAVVAATFAQVDARETTDLLLLTAGSVPGRRASDVWAYAGGASPYRMGTTRAAIGGLGIAAADMDRDGHEDALVAAREGAGLVVLFGDGTGRFPRRADIALPGASEIAIGDVDGDGAPDALVRSAGLHLLLAGPIESLVPRQIHATDLADVTLFDVDGDRAREAVGIDGANVVSVETADEAIRDARVLVTLEGATPERFVLADFDADAKLDLVLLASEGDAVLLVPVPDVAAVGTVVIEASAATAVPEAPLTLTIPLR